MQDVPRHNRSPSRPAGGACTRSGPKIGLVDGPIDTNHPALARCRIRSAARATASCDNPSSPACCHGTFVAGQLASLCPQSELLTYPLFCEAADLRSCPTVRPGHLADALTALIDQGVQIINMSVGLQGEPTGSLERLQACYRRAEREGVVLVAAAGNNGRRDVNPLFYDDWVIPVAAHDHRGQILPTSNRGGHVARQGLVAVGHQVPGLAPGGGFTEMSGTSVAAPMVAAGAALLWSRFPDATAAEIRRALLRPEASRDREIPPSFDLTASEQWLQRHIFHLADNPQRSTMSSNALSSTVVGGLLRPPPEPSPRITAGVVPQACAACEAGNTVGFVYSTGTLDPRFPDEGDRKEFESRAREQQVPSNDFYAVLSKPQNRDLARRICWSLMVNERPAGIVVPRTESELTDLINALNPKLGPNPEVVVTGLLGETAGPDRCNGLEVPLVYLTQLRYFTRAALVEHLGKEINLPSGTTMADFEQVAERIMEMFEVWRQPGFTAAQRAKNYLALRTTPIYEVTLALGEPSNGGFWLQSVSTELVETEAGRSVVYVDLHYQNSRTQTQTQRAEVDVTNLFPFQSKALYQV